MLIIDSLAKSQLILLAIRRSQPLVFGSRVNRLMVSEDIYLIVYDLLESKRKKY